MSATNRRISIIMPAHNVAKYVSATIRSVAAQTRRDYELVVVDDGSSDGTPAALERAAAEWPTDAGALRLLRQENRGAAAARNTGLDAASGSMIAFLDADDLWRPELLEALAGRLEADADVDLVFPIYGYIDEEGRPLGIVSEPPARPVGLRDLLADNPIHSATGVLVRRDAVEAAGRFDEDLEACIDLDLWVRVAARRPGRIVAERRVLVDYRRRTGQITSDWRRMERNWARVVAKASEADPERVGAVAAESRARHCVYWSTIAYSNGEYRDARRLSAEAWRRDPFKMIRSGHAILRGLACLASLLPRGMHDAIRSGFNAIRVRLGLSFS